MVGGVIRKLRSAVYAFRAQRPIQNILVEIGFYDIAFALEACQVLFVEAGVEFHAYLSLVDAELSGYLLNGIQMFVAHRVDDPYQSFGIAVSRSPRYRTAVKARDHERYAYSPYAGLTDAQSHAKQYSAQRQRCGQNNRSYQLFFKIVFYLFHTDTSIIFACGFVKGENARIDTVFKLC